MNAIEVSATDARYDQVMEMMARVLQGQKDTDDKICAMPEKQEVEKKEKEEPSWEARAKEQAEEIAQLKAQAAAGGGVARGSAGQGGGQGQGGAGDGKNWGYQPVGQTPGSPDQQVWVAVRRRSRSTVRAPTANALKQHAPGVGALRSNTTGLTMHAHGTENWTAMPWQMFGRFCGYFGTTQK